MVHDLLPLALRGVECHRDRLLTICMVSCDVEELPSGTGHAHPNRWIREVQVVPSWNTKMASLFVVLGSSVQHLEKRRMYSHRLSPGICLQLRSSHCLLGRVYMPWKLPTKTRRRSAQSWISPRGKC
jgi:hypothetical protein